MPLVMTLLATDRSKSLSDWIRYELFPAFPAMSVTAISLYQAISWVFPYFGTVKKKLAAALAVHNTG
jgi:hypothetical protein